MIDLALQIKLKDWVYILLIGVVLGLLLSILGYRMMELPLLDGAKFGAFLGFSITTFSLIFISWMNHKLLPKISRTYWVAVAIMFSFLSGFLGTQSAILLSREFSILLPKLFVDAHLESSALIGLMTYVVGALLYRFVLMRNQKEMVDRHFIQSRLKSLETQLNPHFLFNALNSVAELIHNDPEKAEDAILKISAFLRSTMQEEALITLQQEFENIEAYVELENIRFSGAVKLSLPQIRQSDIMIPKFSIQLLIENAIKHGFSSERPSLNIDVEFDEKRRSLMVKNDGKPMKKSKFGIGLKNLDERLKYLCRGSLGILETNPPTFIINLGETDEYIDR
jgi:sensor histidine kinase YesM